MNAINKKDGFHIRLFYLPWIGFEPMTYRLEGIKTHFTRVSTVLHGFI